jgi:hypothetical protein
MERAASEQVGERIKARVPQRIGGLNSCKAESHGAAIGSFAW